MSTLAEFRDRVEQVLQDTGNAIRAPGLCDVYMGEGETAEKLAGQTYQEGKLYYLVLK